MCGIAGILYASPAREVAPADLKRARDLLRHRGPDDEGLALDGPCGLVHTRLAILDLSARARQPMASASGRYVLTYNGEIYNFRELREELRARGAAFRTTGDTEIILGLLDADGPEALDRLEGMFAFAVYDRERRALLLMRDRLGIKPLFWTLGPEGFAFASEPKALPPLAERGSPDAATLGEYLVFRHLADEECPQPGVQTLRPGHRLWSDGRSARPERWWSPRAAASAAPERTVEVLSAAVARQVVSDVPVGTFLSGGVDSALVTAAADDALPSLHTFTVGFREAGWDERPRARRVSDALGAERHELELDPDTYVTGLAEATWYLDAPLNHAHSVHLLALSRFARRHIKVALTGEGSDELFAGYPRYRLFVMGRALAFLPGALTGAAGRALRARHPRLSRLCEAARPDPAEAAALNAAFVSPEDAAALVGLERPEALLARRRAILEEAHGAPPVERLLELERRTYLVSLLQRMDRMSMAAGLECRVPVLDERVLEHALALPACAKLDLRDTKKPMRRGAERRFGRALARAPKSGFGVPLDAYLRADTPLARLLGRILDERRTAQRGWFDVGLAKRFHAEHRAGTRDRTEVLFGLLGLELWARACLEGAGPEGV